ncbi:hypothetical protein AGLY_014086 [Aphis glycines]|uniref:Uncharacterized protein n=1 Tax=Aphis glycines TaxID=307491 RepID=A0A6G0T4Q6_APHGL|nr:hypothetical protein AGLY_014086 [Aphis glycines]
MNSLINNDLWLNPVVLNLFRMMEHLTFYEVFAEHGRKIKQRIEFNCLYKFGDQSKYYGIDEQNVWIQDVGSVLRYFTDARTSTGQESNSRASKKSALKKVRIGFKKIYYHVPKQLLQSSHKKVTENWKFHAKPVYNSNSITNQCKYFTFSQNIYIPISVICKRLNLKYASIVSRKNYLDNT